MPCQLARGEKSFLLYFNQPFRELVSWAELGRIVSVDIGYIDILFSMKSISGKWMVQMVDTCVTCTCSFRDISEGEEGLIVKQGKGV